MALITLDQGMSYLTRTASQDKKWIDDIIPRLSLVVETVNYCNQPLEYNATKEELFTVIADSLFFDLPFKPVLTVDVLEFRDNPTLPFTAASDFGLRVNRGLYQIYYGQGFSCEREYRVVLSHGFWPPTLPIVDKPATVAIVPGNIQQVVYEMLGYQFDLEIKKQSPRRGLRSESVNTGTGTASTSFTPEKVYRDKWRADLSDHTVYGLGSL